MNTAASLPAIPTSAEHAPLPQRYEAAVNAIAECERIDECKTWSDKASALASYARQAKDDSLRVMAVRIQARAERRCGELLKQIPRADEATRFGQVGDHPPVTRSKAADDAGLSEHQRKTALRVAAVPEEEFNRQVEGEKPPTVTQLANQGKASRPAFEVARMTAPWATLIDFARWCEQLEPVSSARTLDAAAAARLRSCVDKADRWLTLFSSALCE